MKVGAEVNADKLGVWQCCGQYFSAGWQICPKCGQRRPDRGAARTPHPKPERRKRNALDTKSEIAKALSGSSGRFRVTIERHGPCTLDGDNFVGGCKQLRDAVAELLGKRGDSEADGLIFRYVQIKSDVKKTVIKIMKTEGDME